jgi:hypothetical protein
MHRERSRGGGASRRGRGGGASRGGGGGGAAYPHDESDGSERFSSDSEEESPDRALGGSRAVATGGGDEKSEQAVQLRKISKRLKQENKQLKAELSLEQDTLQQMEADLDREEQLIEDMRAELEELESDQCPVCQELVPHDQIEQHMQGCLRSLTFHVAEKVRRSHAAELEEGAEEMTREARRLNRSLSPVADLSRSRSPLSGSRSPLSRSRSPGRRALAVEEVSDVRPTRSPRGAGSRALEGWEAESPTDRRTHRSTRHSPRGQRATGGGGGGGGGGRFQPPDEHSVWVRDEHGQYTLSFVDS